MMHLSAWTRGCDWRNGWTLVIAVRAVVIAEGLMSVISRSHDDDNISLTFVFGF